MSNQVQLLVAIDTLPAGASAVNNHTPDGVLFSNPGTELPGNLDFACSACRRVLVRNFKVLPARNGFLQCLCGKYCPV